MNSGKGLLALGVLLATLVSGAVGAHGQRARTPGASLAMTAEPLGMAELQPYVRYFEDVLSGSSDAYDNLLSGLYRSNGARAIWYNRAGWTPAGRGVFTVLNNAEVYGLAKQRYLGDVTFSLDQLSSASDVARVDALLTTGVMKYVLDARFGLGHGADPGQAVAVLRELVGASNDEAVRVLEAQNPQSDLFQALVQAMRNPTLPVGQQRQIAVNMHRQRTERFEPKPGKQVIVDVGLQTLKAYEDNRQALDMKVVVGKPERPTPILNDRIVSLKFSPDWTVPSTIVHKDLVPIMATDPSIIADLGLEVRTWNGEPINARTIDWAKYLDGDFPYTFYQRPGLNNLLGGVRFSLTNDFNIYMHDSPDVEAFAHGVRSGSSGCVRVGDATALAHWIMQDERGLTENEVVGLMVAGKTRDIGLRQPVDVKFKYSTATLDAFGRLVLMPDIYGQDLELAKKIGV